MQFNVELSELAERQYDEILSYIAYELKNPQALKNVMDDIKLILLSTDICLCIE